ELMTAHVEDPAPPLAAAAPAVPAALAALVMRCLAKEPRDRPAGATALLEALTTALAGDAAEGALLPPSPRAARHDRVTRRTRIWMAAAGGALAALAVLGASELLARRAAAPEAGAARAASSSLAVLPF